jgi:hypothetical protein
MPEAVLNNLDAQMVAGSRLREEKAAAEANNNESPQKGGGSFRERVMAARQAMDLKEMAKKKLEEKVTAPAKAGTSWLLKASWLNLIDSFGLTLIYINLHVFGRWVLGEKFFCKLGEEWLPKEASAVGGEAGKTAGRAVGIVEIMALLILDLIVIFIIFVILGILILIVSWWSASWGEKIAMIFKAITNLGWGAVSDLKALFSF